MTNWNVFHVYYMTYEEIDALPEPRRTRAIEGRDRELIATSRSFNAAKQMVEEKGFGYSMHPV